MPALVVKPVSGKRRLGCDVGGNLKAGGGAKQHGTPGPLPAHHLQEGQVLVRLRPLHHAVELLVVKQRHLRRLGSPHHVLLPRKAPAPHLRCKIQVKR